MAHYLMTGFLKYLRRHILLYAVYHKMLQGKRLIVDWIEGRTHGQIGDKESILMTPWTAACQALLSSTI